MKKNPRKVAIASHAFAPQKKEVPVVVSATKMKAYGANLMLADLAVILLAGIDPAMAPQLKPITNKLRQDTIQRWGDDYPRLVSCKNVLDTFARKLLECKDLQQVYLALNAVEAINTGNLFLAADDQEVIMVDKDQ
ncbi:hypothetical protein [Telluribacter humicola]|uniref:hypothetical protein n=1 Tax=Telluribacter humicola TaxID=1720261 RepID=UPI001A975474|nr:hypothetical protein [Telluribacter humicola]